MAEASIDIELPEELQEFLKIPACVDVALPKASEVSIQLPNGGKLKGIADITKAIPDNCSLSFSLALQLAPFLASIECLVKILQFIKPLIEVMTDLTKLQPPSPKVIEDFTAAAIEVTKCFVAISPAGMIPFIRDILCLIIKLMRCFIDQLKTIASFMGGIQLQLASAVQSGNSQLQQALECAQENGVKSAQHTMAAIDPIMLILEMVKPLLEFTPVSPIEIPTFGSAEDVESMNETIEQLETFVQILEAAAELVGGCGK